MHYFICTGLYIEMLMFTCLMHLLLIWTLQQKRIFLTSMYITFSILFTI